MDNALFLSFDDNYWLYARACLNSLAANFPHHPEVVVYYPGNSEPVLANLAKRNRLRLIQNLPGFRLPEQLSTGEVGSLRVYDKYFAWSSFFDDYANVLYLDCDVLILRPLDSLFQTDEFMVASNHEPDLNVAVFSPEHQTNSDLSRLLDEDELTYPYGPDAMCNAGVLLLPPSCRKGEFYESLLKFTCRYNKFVQYADQSAITLWCMKHDISPKLDLTYNFQTPFFGMEEELCQTPLSEISILHFSSKRKPDTFDFIMWQRIPKTKRQELARLFFSYTE